MIDWEREFCVVIGRRCHRVSFSEALDYAVGYTFLNDVSVIATRDAFPEPLRITWKRWLTAWSFNRVADPG